MQLKTKYFSTIDYDQSDILDFPCGLFGFEDEKKFLLLPFEGADSNLLCFQSVCTPTLAFVVMNPFSLNPAYAPIVTSEELKTMGVEKSEDLCYYVMCVVREPVGASTVNFKCPVVINDITRKAMQVILETDEFHMRHLLSEFGGSADGKDDA